MELWAAAQAYVPVSCKSTALLSLSLQYCGQRRARRGAIQGTYFLGRKLPVKPQFSVQGVLMFHVCLGNGTGRHEVPETESGYREQKKKQSCDGKVWRSNTVLLSFS